MADAFAAMLPLGRDVMDRVLAAYEHAARAAQRLGPIHSDVDPAGAYDRSSAEVPPPGIRLVALLGRDP